MCATVPVRCLSEIKCSCTAVKGRPSWLCYVRVRCNCSALDSLKRSFRILRGCRALLLALISACVLWFKCAVYRRSKCSCTAVKGRPSWLCYVSRRFDFSTLDSLKRSSGILCACIDRRTLQALMSGCVLYMACICIVVEGHCAGLIYLPTIDFFMHCGGRALCRTD